MCIVLEPFTETEKGPVCLCVSDTGGCRVDGHTSAGSSLILDPMHTCLRDRLSGDGGDISEFERDRAPGRLPVRSNFRNVIFIRPHEFGFLSRVIRTRRPECHAERGRRDVESG